MFLTYQKSLPSFDQHMVQLEMDEPSDEKVYVGFHEGFIPLAAKYHEYSASLAAEVPAEEVIIGTVLIDETTVKEEVKEPQLDETQSDETPVTKKARKTSV